MATARQARAHWRGRLPGILAGALALAVLLHPEPGKAAEVRALPVDAVILLDDSGSMRQTDPLKLRFAALALLAQLLQPDDAVGLVRFDDAAAALVPLHLMSTAEDRHVLDKAAARFTARGRYTNLYAGLETALRQAQQRRRSQATPVVLLISDGLMDVNPATGLSNEEATRRLRQTLLPAYQQAQVRVVTLALSTSADRALLREIATATNGAFFDAPDAQALSQALLRIFERLKAPDLVPVRDQRVALDASIKEVTFVILVDTATEDVALVRPDGRKLRRNSRDPSAKWFVGKDYVLCTIQRPPAGEWRIETTRKRPTKVVVITDVRLDVTLEPEQAVAGQDVRITAQLVSTGHVGPAALPLAELGLRAEVSSSEAAPAMTLPMTPREGPSPAHTLGPQYSTVYTAPAVPGDYEGRVIATAPTFSRERSFVLRVRGPQAIPSTVAPPTPGPPAANPVTPSPALGAPGLSDDASPAPATSEAASALEGAPASLRSSLWRVLWRLAIAHGVLLILAGGVSVGRRLIKGTWGIKQTPLAMLLLGQEGRQERDGP